MISNAYPQKNRVDFKAIKEAAIRAIDTLLSCWLPSGRREQNEWVALNPTRNDSTHGSFKVNRETGVWKDFATGDAGSDLIDLYAYLNGVPLLEAARKVGEILDVRLTPRTATIHTIPRVVRAGCDDCRRKPSGSGDVPPTNTA